MAKKIPPALMEPAIRLEVAGTPDAHQGLAEETKNFLATQNVDSFVVSDSDTTRALIIKPEPLNADQPVNVLTSLSRGLLEKVAWSTSPPVTTSPISVPSTLSASISAASLP